MKKESIIIILPLVILSVILAGCQTGEVVCNKPYIKVGTSCCLDQNDNNICDSDESTATQVSTKKTTEDTLEQNTDIGTEILSYNINFKEGSSAKYSQYKIVGEIQNNDVKIDYPKVYFIGYDKDKGIVCTKNTYAEFKPLNKGESSPFQLSFYLDDCPNLETYKIKFENALEEGNINDVETNSESSGADSKTDKCSSMIDWTVSGTEEQQEICYNSKYLQYSISKDNVSICDEIVSEAWLGRCYANFAFNKEDVTICSNTPDLKYTAKGYYEELSARDVCYAMYVESLGVKLLNEYKKVDVPENVCNSISNEQLKESCVTKIEAIEETNKLI